MPQKHYCVLKEVYRGGHLTSAELVRCQKKPSSHSYSRRPTDTPDPTERSPYQTYPTITGALDAIRYLGADDLALINEGGTVRYWAIAVEQFGTRTLTVRPLTMVAKEVIQAEAKQHVQKLEEGKYVGYPFQNTELRTYAGHTKNGEQLFQIGNHGKLVTRAEADRRCSQCGLLYDECLCSPCIYCGHYACTPDGKICDYTEAEVGTICVNCSAHKDDCRCETFEPIEEYGCDEDDEDEWPNRAPILDVRA